MDWDWNEMLVVALQAGLTHDQFWNSTVHEVLLSTRARMRHMRDTKRLLAWAVSNIMSAWLGRKAPSVNRLMGGTSLMGMSKEQIAAHYARKEAAQ